MKPIDLKSPFTWDKRHIVVHDRIWYVPDQYDDFASFSFPGWSHTSIFGDERPVCIEYCSGNGTWITEKAKKYPQYNWVGIERKFERVRKIWSKVKNFELSNLLTICGEGYRTTHHFIPDRSVHKVYINYPDPWPKTRHAKHRLVQVSFIHEVHRILQTGGQLIMVTDDESHSQYMIDVLHKVSGFQSEFPNPYYVNDYPEYGTSYFEELWRQKGKLIHYHVFRKINE